MRTWLKSIRESKGLTQGKVADGSNITASYYSMIESNTRTPNVNVAKRIAKTLSFEWEHFFK